MDTSTRRIFVGCSTDRRFVNPSCAMLASLDDKGQVPEAVVLVADFGLDDDDRRRLRRSAGALGKAMQFVAVPPDSPKILARPAFDFPQALLGRLILPSEISARGARLLLIDSDMIVNGSLRPLFDMDMGGHPLAAGHDPLWIDDPEYFNAGLMLLDLDVFNRRQLGAAAMYRLAAYPERPSMLDQDALNDVIGKDWARLDRSWNFFQIGIEPHFERPAYDAVHIIHFAGPKPWVFLEHPAAPLYHGYLTQAEEMAWRRAAVDALAVGKPALTSSVSPWSRLETPERDARGANAGWVADDLGFHTTFEFEPWWMVDLQAEHVIDALVILNREICAERFSNFRIESSRDGSSWINRLFKIDGQTVSADPHAPWRQDFSDPFLARYLRIRMIGTGVLHLRRVQVFGTALPGRKGPAAAA